MQTNPLSEKAESSAPKIRAAQYVRMSTEHQKYSTENQGDVIREYAARRGFEIVRTYADDGKSGLKMEGRDSLRALIDDVQDGRADFKAILVYAAAASSTPPPTEAIAIPAPEPPFLASCSR